MEIWVQNRTSITSCEVIDWSSTMFPNDYASGAFTDWIRRDHAHILPAGWLYIFWTNAVAHITLPAKRSLLLVQSRSTYVMPDIMSMWQCFLRIAFFLTNSVTFHCILGRVMGPFNSRHGKGGSRCAPPPSFFAMHAELVVGACLNFP